MREGSLRSRGGAHRKKSHASHRIAVATVTAAAATSVGSGLAVATPAPVDEDNSHLTAQAASSDSSTAPTVVSVQDFRPVGDLSTQLNAALQFNQERKARDLADRMPKLVSPADGAFTSGFGPRWGSMHNGIDIANVTNTPIRTIMDGTVIDSGPAQGYGQWIRVLHDDGAVSVYGHLESLYVSVGEKVSAGQEIGGMGNRGFSTGTHLHFEIHPDGSTPVDPIQWFIERGLALFAGAVEGATQFSGVS